MFYVKGINVFILLLVYIWEQFMLKWQLQPEETFFQLK